MYFLWFLQDLAHQSRLREKLTLWEERKSESLVTGNTIIQGLYQLQSLHCWCRIRTLPSKWSIACANACGRTCFIDGAGGWQLKGEIELDEPYFFG